MKTKFVLFLSLFIVFSIAIKAQYYTSGEAPFSVKWKQINTSRFQIIFPNDYEAQAQLFAHKLDYAYPFLGYSLKHEKMKKMTIVLYNQPSYSNGLTMWAPSRIEIYTAPNQGMYGQEWLDQLLIHETRHFEQIDKLNLGFTKGMSILFGEQGTGMTLGLFVPPWYMEGDAVTTETLLSHVGRGRSPQFHQGVRALTLTEGKQKYDRAMLGSYNYFIPNQYGFGYQIVTVNRYLSKFNVFEPDLEHIGHSFWPITFFTGKQHALRDRGPIKYYDRAFDYLSEQWRKQDSILHKTQFIPISLPPKVYANYSQLVSDGNILLAQKESFSKAPTFVALKADGEKEILQRGYRSNGRLSASSKLLVWDEPVQDTRYALRSYSVIKVYNIASKKVHTLKAKTRWFAPALLMNKVLLVNENIDNHYSLKIVDVENGNELWNYSTSSNDYFQQPFWIDSTTIGAILNGNEGQSLVSIDINNKTLEILIPFGYQKISNPVYYNQKIYFTGSWSGISNIYCYQKESKEITQITSSRFGADYAAPTFNELYYVDYTSKGNQVVKLNDSFGKPLQEIRSMALNLQDSILYQEKKVLQLEEADTTHFMEKAYSKWNLFRFHSWGISGSTVDSQYGFQPGVSLMSQNTLGTSILTMGYDAAQSHSWGKYYLNYSYRALWPIFDIGLKGGNRKIQFNNDYQIQANGWTNFYADTKQNTLNVDLKVTLPFNFSAGVWSRKLYLWTDLSKQWYSSYQYQINRKDSLGNINATDNYEQNATCELQIEYGMRVYNLQNTSLRQLQPRWGQVVTARFIRDVEYGSSIWGIEGSEYFPGLMLNHGIRLGMAYEQRGNVDQAMFYSDIVSTSRGYSFIPSGDNMLYFTANYNMPIVYPDWSIGSLLYLKRLTSNFFYDASNIRYRYVPNANVWMNSSGVELLGDFNFLRYEHNFKLGFRVGWRDYDQRVFGEFLFSIQL